MNYEIKEYSKEYEKDLIELLMRVCVNEYNMRDYEASLRQYVEEEEFQKAWIILDNERIIATIGYEERDNKVAELKRVYIDKDYRHQGLGTSMMYYVVQYLEDNNYDTIYVRTVNNFSNAIKFYKKYGFENIFDDGEKYVFKMQLRQGA